MQHEPLTDDGLGAELCQLLTDLLQEGHAHLHRVVGWVLHQQEQNLQRYDLVSLATETQGSREPGNRNTTIS